MIRYIFENTKMVLYHGTDLNIDEILKKKYIFVSKNKEHSKDFGSNIYELKVNMKNIFNSLDINDVQIIYNKGYKLYDDYSGIEFETPEDFINSYEMQSDSWESIEKTYGVTELIFSLGYDSILITEGGYVNYLILIETILDIQEVKILNK